LASHPAAGNPLVAGTKALPNTMCRGGRLVECAASRAGRPPSGALRQRTALSSPPWRMVHGVLRGMCDFENRFFYHL